MSINPETANTEKKRPKLWFVAGAVLWLLVGAAVIFVVQSRRDPAGPVNPSASVPVVDPRTTEDDVATPASPEIPADQLWDPQGIEDFALTDSRGETVTKEDLLGQPWAICFVFTRCAGPCPKVSGQMKQLRRALQDKPIRFVTLTVDPKNDTPEVMARYADALGADPENWLFLTGDQDEIYHLIQHSFRMPVKEMLGEDRMPGYEIMHTTNVLHVDAQGRVVGKYNALKDTDIVKLRRALLSEIKDLPAATPESKEEA